ncbi:hypothetical protein Q5752_004694 [Cryptotrichosporon argae]
MPRPRRLLPVLLALLALAALVSASAGDRNPTYQHCLKGCSLTHCQVPSPTPLPIYLSALGWTCESDCAYRCAHRFVDNMHVGSRQPQFHGKWAFYRVLGVQEAVAVAASLGNLWVNLQGIRECLRRVRRENKLRNWLLVLGAAQVNTWIWSAVFHTRDTPVTERLDYLSATLTITLSLLYAIVRIFHLATPLSTSRHATTVGALLGLLVLGHVTYVLSLPTFPYGYNVGFNVCLGLAHHLLWVLFSASFVYRLNTGLSLGGIKLAFPSPYPPRDPLRVRPRHAVQPLILVALTTAAMALELLDFSPYFRLVDAHALWHAATIPLAAAWWSFFIDDAIEREGAALGLPATNVPISGFGGVTALPARAAAGSASAPGQAAQLDAKLQPPATPTLSSFAQIASSVHPTRSPRSPARSPGRVGDKGDYDQ